jgi:S-adenosylmethionine:tRNA-ribosyltransferase-isomerase (queuine synthetase)
MSEEIRQSYYRDNLPDLINDLKEAVQNNRKVITQKVTGDLTEDKYVNVLKSRRMAADDTIHFLKEIDRLEAELNGTELEEKTEKRLNPSKRFAQQQ